MLTFEALFAKHGDCLLLRSGSAGAEKLVVIDGGPSGVYPNLKKRLDELRGEKETLPIELVMVSHVDDDHINGLLAMMRELRKKKEDQEALPYRPKKFWLNSFEDLAGSTGSPSSVATLSALSGTGGASGASMVSHPHVQAILASINQGRKLRDIIAFLELEDNQPIGGLVVGAKTPVKVAGLHFHIVGPLKKEIDELRKKWEKTKSSATASLADYLDKSAENLSSIVCLVKSGAKTILLTGDARGDHVLAGLQKFGHIKSNGKLKLDILKVPHHGSTNNVESEFFERLPAKNYILSGDGRDDNPERQTLEWLIEARGEAKYTIHLTKRLPWMKKFFDKMQEDRNFTVNYLGDDGSDRISIKL